MFFYASSMSAEWFGTEGRCQIDINESLPGVFRSEPVPFIAQVSQLATSSCVRHWGKES